MTAVSDETGRGWLPLKYEDGPDFCTVTFATGAAFALTVHPERMKLMEAALSASPVAQEPVARLCGYCKTWNSKPCGEQCYLSPSDPVWTSPPATPAGVGADKLRELASCLDRALGDTDPSISSDYTDDEIKRDYPVFWVCQQLNAILALLSRAGDQK